MTTKRGTEESIVSFGGGKRRAMADDGGANAGGDKKKGVLGEVATAESMIQLALALPIGCTLGWLLGSALDKHFHTAWMGVVGILLGAAAGFVQIFRTVSRYLKRNG
jgi:F0F1-type ATP synthase assembly protein I